MTKVNLGHLRVRLGMGIGAGVKNLFGKQQGPGTWTSGPKNCQADLSPDLATCCYVTLIKSLALIGQG